MRLSRGGLTFEQVKRHPRGLDLGPLEPERARKVRTPDGKVRLAPEVLVADVARLERWVEARRAARPELVLIGRRNLRSNNSWQHNLPSLAKGPDRARLLMHPTDAQRLGLASGERVRVKGPRAALEVALEVTSEVMPGVVSLPHGFGHAEAAETMRVAGALAGPNVNEITDEALVEPVTGMAILNGVPVTVEKVEPAKGA